VAGQTFSFDVYYGDFWVLKLDSSGNIGGCPVQGLSTVITKEPAYIESFTTINGQPSAGIESPTFITDQNTFITPYTICE